MCRTMNSIILIALVILAAILLLTPQLERAATLSATELETVLSQVTIDPTYSHAEEEHPVDAPMVRDCLSKKGAYMQFEVEKHRRYLRVCILDEYTGLIGFQIVDIVGRVAKERTAYIKENIRCIKDLLEYARKMGYPRYTKPL